MNAKLTTWHKSLAAGMARSSVRGLVYCALVLLIFVGLVWAILGVSDKARPQVAATNSPKPRLSKSAEPSNFFNASNLLETSAQRKQKLTTQKANEIASLIKKMPGVAGSKILLEPGQPAKLGKKSVKPSAVIYVEFNDDAQMNSDMLKSMIALVTGSVSGLDEKAVRVVTSRGLSYRLDDVGVLPGDHTADLVIRKKQESLLRDNILKALGYINGLSVSATVKPYESQWLPGEIVVNVPRSFAENIFNKSQADLSGGNRDEIMASIMDEQTQRIREIVTLSGGRGGDIVVQWYYDKPREVAQAAAEPLEAGVVAFVTVMSFAECLILGSLAAIRVRRGQHRKAWARLRAMARRRRKAVKKSNGFDFLRLVGEDELVILFKQEKPLAVAVALANLPAARAANVLERLSGEMQIEVARRMAGIENVAPEVSRNISRRLLQRMEIIAGSSNADGISAVARILQHSNQAGRKKVLEALRRQEPRLAESIGRLLVGFEDVAGMSHENLAPALESMQIEDIAVALWSASENVQRNVFESMPVERTKEVMVKMQGLGNVKPAKIELAQQQLVELIRDCEVAKTAIARASEKVLA